MHPQEPRPELGEHAALQWTRTNLCRLLRDFFRHRWPDSPVRVGTDTPFYYDPADRLARVTPDIYVVEGLGTDEELRSYRVWERGGVAPQFAVHLVDAPVAPEDGLMMHFLRLGLLDVVLYDPLWHLQPPQAPTGRRLLWHYQREDERLSLQRQEHPARVFLRRHGFWLVHRGGADLRVYADGGDGCVPVEGACWPLPEEQERANAAHRQ